ncbi:hypothetical protein BDV93DRAFT_525007 [Ceratobasidium sp. AG-I]|nr:hypothetical protein BDV93DRAFT_525007 [Ceratobasidium sp. AG-I]
MGCPRKTKGNEVGHGEIDDGNETTRPIERFVSNALEQRLENPKTWARDPDSEDGGDQTTAHNRSPASGLARRLGLGVSWMRAAVTRVEARTDAANAPTPRGLWSRFGSTDSSAAHAYAAIGYGTMEAPPPDSKSLLAVFIIRRKWACRKSRDRCRRITTGASTVFSL